MPSQPVYPWGPKVGTGLAAETAANEPEVSEVAFEQKLDSWSVDHLDAAIALHQIVREHLKKTGYGHIGKAIAHLELPNQRQQA